MGKYYKTTSAVPIDYMHRDNSALMERALLFNDAAITDQYAQAQETNDVAAAFNRLTDDEQRAAQIGQEYANKINELTKAIAANPSNYKNYSEPLRKLKQDLATNFRTGEISKIQANYATYKTWKNRQDKMVEQWNKFGGKKGGIDPLTAQVYEQAYLNKWRENGTGTSFKNGQYNTLHMEDVMANMNLKDEIAKGFDKVKADLNAVEDNNRQGYYLIKTGDTVESVPKSKLVELAMANLSDPTLQTYMRSRQGVGLLNNIYDKDGNMINPISGFGIDPAALERGKKMIEDTKASDPKKAAQMQAELDAYVASQSEIPRYNPNSGLAPLIEGAVNSSSWLKKTHKEDIKADPVAFPAWMQSRREYQQKLTRDQNERHFQTGRQDKKDAAEKLFDRQKELIDLRKKAAVEVKATGKASATTTKALENAYAQTYINEIPAPDRSYAEDLSMAGSDAGAKTRVDLAWQEAVPKVVQSVGKIPSSKGIDPYQRESNSGDYLRWLNGRVATDQLAETYYNQQSAAKVPGYNTFPGGQRPGLNFLKDVGKKYNEEIDNVYKQHNIESNKVNTNPLTVESQKQIADLINTSTGGYFTIDADGNKLSKLPKLKQIIGSTGGSNQSKIGYRAITEGGKEMWVFPNDDVNVYNVNKSAILNGLLDKNSAYAVSLKVEDINNIKTSLMQGRKVEPRTVEGSDGKLVQQPGGYSNVITIGNDSFPAILEENTGQLTVRDEDGAELETYASVGQFVSDYYRHQAAVLEQEAKAKK